MIKGRMFVVDDNSLSITQSSLVASIKVPFDDKTPPHPLPGLKWKKTVADIMADLFQTEIGDYVFLWKTKSTNVKGSKSQIYGVYRVVSKPYYQCASSTDNAPFKIHIARAYDFDNPIDEYDVLNCPYIRHNLWTIVGKKTAGKSRGTSPLSQEEVKDLILLLIGKNPNFSFYPPSSTPVVPVLVPLSLTYNSSGVDARPASLLTFNPNGLHFFDAKGNVSDEKVIETIFNMELSNKTTAAPFFSQLGINSDKVVWFSNYLPYSVEQSEMDYVIIESEDGISPSKIFVLEFQKEPIDDDHIYRSLLYSKWVNETLGLGASIAQPILIAKSSVDFLKGEKAPTKIAKVNSFNAQISSEIKQFNVKDLMIYTYDFTTPKPTFTRKR